MKIGFIGAGRVGFTLGKYFCEHGVEVAGYCSRNIQSAQEAAGFTNSRVFDLPAELLEACDIFFLTVPDGMITKVYKELCQESIRGKILCHASGAVAADEAFPDIEAYGASGYSVHPFFAVSDRYNSYRELADVFFTLEGTASGLENMLKWLQGTGLKVQVIKSDSKALYHGAACIACNQVAALFAEAQEMLMQCGFPKETAMEALKSIFLGNARHIAEVGAVQALTGPVQRGDAVTLARHLAVLKNPKDKLLYILLSEKLMDIAMQGKPDYPRKNMEEFLTANYQKLLLEESDNLMLDKS